MKRAASYAALIMVLLGIAAVLLVPAAPRMLTRLRPAELWGGRVEAGAAGARAGGALTGGAQAAGGSGESALASLPPVRPTMHVLEQVSPIVGSGSTLVEALGIEMHGKFTTVLPKGTPAPVRRVVTFRTSGDDQKEIRLHVLRGLSEAAAEDHTLGWVRVGDLPPGPRGSTQIAVTFAVADGAIILTAVNPADGRAFPIEPSEAPPGFMP